MYNQFSLSSGISFILGKQVIAFVCAIQLSSFLFGQNLPTVDAITIEDGLGFRNVRAIAQDRQGLMWLATQQGLNRFDGYQFTYYNKGPLGDHPLPAEDFAEEGMIIRDNGIWYIANKRLFYLNIWTNEVTPIKISAPEDQSTGFGFIATASWETRKTVGRR